MKIQGKKLNFRPSVKYSETSYSYPETNSFLENKGLIILAPKVGRYALFS